MTDLFGYLWFNHLENISSRPLVDRDVAAQEIEQLLDHGDRVIEEEARIFRSYTELSFDERLDLNPAIHEWVLERMANSGSAEPSQFLAQVVTEAFFIPGPPTVPFLAVNALLAFDRRVEVPESHVSMIWRSLARQEDDPTLQLTLLLDILLDLHFLSTDRFPALRALRDMMSDDRTRDRLWGFRAGVRQRLLRRAETLSGDLAADLMQIARPHNA